MRDLLPVHPLVSEHHGKPDVEYMKTHREAIPPAERVLISRYLSSSSLVVAWMEFTTDLIGGRFGVPGGSAINSDGEYYWRVDGANYVETYGVELDPQFLAHGRSRDWLPVVLTESEAQRAEAYLESINA